MKILWPDLESDHEQQIKEFNQALSRLADQQYQSLQEHLMARHGEIVNELATGRGKSKRQRMDLTILLQNALTGASHWLIEKLLMLEVTEPPELPLPDGKDVIVIDSNCTVIPPNRKEKDHGSTDAQKRSDRLGTAAESDHPGQ